MSLLCDQQIHEQWKHPSLPLHYPAMLKLMLCLGWEMFWLSVLNKFHRYLPKSILETQTSLNEFEQPAFGRTSNTAAVTDFVAKSAT